MLVGHSVVIVAFLVLFLVPAAWGWLVERRASQRIDAAMKAAEVTSPPLGRKTPVPRPG